MSTFAYLSCSISSLGDPRHPLRGVGGGPAGQEGHQQQGHDQHGHSMAAYGVRALALAAPVREQRGPGGLRHALTWTLRGVRVQTPFSASLTAGRLYMDKSPSP